MARAQKFHDIAPVSEKRPHVIDLRGRPRLRHEHDYKLDELQARLQAGLANASDWTPVSVQLENRSWWKPRSEKKTARIKVFREEPRAEATTNRRWHEAMRMVAMGVVTVFTLNLINVYYAGQDLKDEVATAAYSSYESILVAGFNQDAFDQANAYFQDAAESLWFLQNQRRELQEQSQIASEVSDLIAAGESLTAAGGDFVAFVDNARALTGDILAERVDGQASLTEQWQATFDADFMPALTQLRTANDNVQAVKATLFPKDLQATLVDAQSQLDELTGVLTKFEETFPIIMRLLGDEHPQRYLVLLENNAELRPGGGFIGSYMIVDIDEGYLDGMTFHDVYDIDGQYYEDITPPGEIASLTNNWRFRDSNYSPDLNVSLAKSAWFLEEQGGPGVDQVVMVDLTFVSELLEITGPIKTERLPVALDSTNFSQVLSFMVETKLTGETTPKEVLGEFVEVAQAQIAEQAPWGELVQLMQEMAAGKHFAMYSDTETVQDFFADFGVSGAFPVVEAGEDILAITHTSIGGNKTDAYMDRLIEHDTQIDASGHVTNTVTLSSTHQWNELVELQLRNSLSAMGFTDIPSYAIDILGRGANVSATRVYVPHGAQLIGTSGIAEADITRHYDQDLGLDYFYFVITTYPGETTEMALTYQLPQSLSFTPLDEYRLHIVKQPGDEGSLLIKTIQADSQLVHYRSFPEALLEDTQSDGFNRYSWTTLLDRDLHVAQLWGQ
jgi:hypothetical protein